MPYLLALTARGFFLDIGRGLREGFFMFYETIWALVRIDTRREPSDSTIAPGADGRLSNDQCAARRAKARIVAKRSTAANPIRITPATA
jgi:hypothetical protein